MCLALLAIHQISTRFVSAPTISFSDHSPSRSLTTCTYSTQHLPSPIFRPRSWPVCCCRNSGVAVRQCPAKNREEHSSQSWSAMKRVDGWSFCKESSPVRLRNVASFHSRELDRASGLGLALSSLNLTRPHQTLILGQFCSRALMANRGHFMQ